MTLVRIEGCGAGEGEGPSFVRARGPHRTGEGRTDASREGREIAGSFFRESSGGDSRSGRRAPSEGFSFFFRLWPADFGGRLREPVRRTDGTSGPSWGFSGSWTIPAFFSRAPR